MNRTKKAFISAVKGNRAATRYFITLVHNVYFKRHALPPQGLLRFYVRTVEKPDVYAEVMKPSELNSPHRPSVDDQAFDVIGNPYFEPFGRKPSEKNALMIAYLLSTGMAISAESTQRESAVRYLSQYRRRSPRSLQNDYYRHRSKITGAPDQLGLGKSYLEWLKKLKQIKKARHRNK